MLPYLPTTKHDPSGRLVGDIYTFLQTNRATYADVAAGKKDSNSSDLRSMSVMAFYLNYCTR